MPPPYVRYGEVHSHEEPVASMFCLAHHACRLPADPWADKFIVAISGLIDTGTTPAIDWPWPMPRCF